MERLFKVKWEHYRIWKLLGTELGIDMDTLNTIEDIHVGRGCLRAMIDNAEPRISREAMANVLQSEVITNAIAGRFEFEFVSRRVKILYYTCRSSADS